jgi:hypothetical protein
MKSSYRYWINVIAVGFLVLLVFCVSLFWCRVYSQALIRERLGVNRSPSGLVAEDIEKDPNTVLPSQLVCKRERAPEWIFLGSDGGFDDWWYANFMRDRLGPQARSVQVSSARHEDGWVKRAWQPKTGQIVETLYAERKTKERTIRWDQAVSAYVGPLGFSAQQTEALGRFHDPVVADDATGKHTLLVYDRKQRCFFRLDFAEQKIQQGPEIPSAMSILQMGDVSKNKAFLSTYWHAPQRLETEQERSERMKIWEEVDANMIEMYGMVPGGPGSPYGGGPGEPMMDPRMMGGYGMESGMPGSPYGGGPGEPMMDPCDMERMASAEEGTSDQRQPLTSRDFWKRVAFVQGGFSAPRGMTFVLSTSGAVHGLDEETLHLSPALGRFPRRMSAKANTPKSALAYQVKALHVGQEYAGCVVSTLARDGKRLGVAVFDKTGITVSDSSSGYTLRHGMTANVKTAIALGRVADVLNPLGLSLVSLAYGANSEAMLSHRSLFIRPNGYAANVLQVFDSATVDRVAMAVFLGVLSLLMAIFLAWLIARDSVRLGLPRSTRNAWTWATLAFGLVAYITYCLTRPELSLVTCANCGRLRRVDQGQCHLCDAQWEVPELNAPAWRVV